MATAKRIQQTDTTCPYCGVGCGVRISSDSRGQHQVAGIDDHPANLGKLCVKGSALAQTLDMSTRLLQPQRVQNGSQEAISWAAATDEIAQRMTQAIAEYGPESVAFYVSGQLLTEDYYVVNKFVKGFLGSANIDTNSRLCMSSAVAGHKRAFGEDAVPVCYEDLEQAELLVITGSNMAWCHPVLFRRIRETKERNPNCFIVVIDPRYSASCELADLHLPLRPGSDVALFNGLLHYLHQHGCTDNEFVHQHCLGVEDSLQAASAYDLAEVAKRCDLQESAVLAFYQKFQHSEKAITLFSMGVNQSSQGTDKVNSIINCHLYTGRIGKEGCGPFSLTGQPNAMGGREVGGLANMLAAHMELANPAQRDAVQRFWGSPKIAEKPGLKAVELFQAVEAGSIKVLWVMATNPVVSLPDADQVKRALTACEFVVVSDVCAQTDTSALADILLPALAWGEKSGTVTNSERCISRQRAFLAAPEHARPDWWAVAQVASKMGFHEAFAYHHPVQIFTEHARLSAFENGDQYAAGRRLFNLEALSELDEDSYNAFLPRAWPLLAGQTQSSQRLFSDGRFAFADGKARMVAVQHSEPKNTTSSAYPLVLNTGRIRDQWHTMTRTGLASSLGAHIPEPFVDMHPQDALLAGLPDQSLARVTSAWGALVVRVMISGTMRRGQIFIPIHWSDHTASDARVGALVNPVLDPISGQPEFKHTPVKVEPFGVKWQAVSFSKTPLQWPQVANWTKIQVSDALRYELSGRQKLRQLAEVKALLLTANPQLRQRSQLSSAHWLEYSDESSGRFHLALIVGQQLEACLYIAGAGELPDRQWLARLFSKERLGTREYGSILAGMCAQASSNSPMVCSCFSVSQDSIVQAIKEKGLKTTKEVTACLKAGGNCGSCLPEIGTLLSAS